jgi:ABC-2 type transport system permease protein
MITDIATIVRKELMELLFQRGQGRSSTIRMLIFIGVFGILLPLQNGIRALTSPAGMIFWLWIPYMLISGVTADTFAGERERHTLETLLASRLSDRAILFGKLGAIIGYGWGMTLITILVNLITVNLFFWQGSVVFYPPLLLGVLLLVTLQISVFSAGLGIVISLRSATTRAAQQTMSILVFVLIIPLFLLSFLPPAIMTGIIALLSTINVVLLGLGVIIILFVVDIALILFNMAQFRRAKLVSG